ncbi:MAG: hypothetical protein ACD_15C00176G0002 [uncultured bacterium]|nr:MAG: hypothetical protein ACD_15C00176G0002 [uncultured bacterium]
MLSFNIFNDYILLPCAIFGEYMRHFSFPKRKVAKKKKAVQAKFVQKFSACSLKFPKMPKGNLVGNFLTLTSFNL